MENFEVYHEDIGEWVLVRGFDHQEAAEEWAEQEDWKSAEYWIAKNGGLQGIKVRKKGESEEKVFGVNVESKPKYHAYETKYPHEWRKESP